MSIKKLYHVSCALNHDSIMTLGLTPFLYTSFNEVSGPVYLAKRKPSRDVSLMRPVFENRENPILDDYLQMSSNKHKTCPYFNLYEIDTSNLDLSLFGKTSDKREVTYSGVIPPENINLLRQYNTLLLEQKYLENEESAKWAAFVKSGHY